MCISRAVQRLLLIHHSRLRHQFQPCAIIEGDEVGAEISPGIVVAVIGLPAEIGGKEIPRRIQVVHISRTEFRAERTVDGSFISLCPQKVTVIILFISYIFQSVVL